MLHTLNESIDQRVAIGEALAKSRRWAPYCEGLKGPMRSTMAMLLESQYRHFKNMNEMTRVVNVGNFDKYALPVIRAVYPNTIASELVSIQAMSGPTSMVFYMDFVYASTKGGITGGTNAFDARLGPTGNETYTSDAVTGQALTIDSTNIVQPSLPYVPIRPGTVTITFTAGGTTYTVVDDGNGGFTGATLTSGSINYQTGAVSIDHGSSITGTPTMAYRYDNEATENIPQLDIQLTQSSITAEPRKIKARWSLESAQQLQALQGLDAEAEIVGAMAEVLRHEIDRQIINDLLEKASAGTVTWDKTVPAGISWTEHKLSLVDAFVSGSNKVFQATKRGQTNFIVAGLAVCDVIETLPSFVPTANAWQTQASTGCQKIGTLNGRWTVYKDPFMTTTSWLQGYKGNGMLDTGYVYAPWIPLYSTPTTVLDDFIGRKGMATMYGTKLVNSKFYVTGTLLAP